MANETKQKQQGDEQPKQRPMNATMAIATTVSEFDRKSKKQAQQS